MAGRSVNACAGAGPKRQTLCGRGWSSGGKGGVKPTPEQVRPGPPAPAVFSCPSLAPPRLSHAHSRFSCCFVLGRAPWHVRAYFPDQELNPSPCSGSSGSSSLDQQGMPTPHLGIAAPLIPTTQLLPQPSHTRHWHLPSSQLP